jgi:WD40 repeat protein
MPETPFEEKVRTTLREQADKQPFDPQTVKPTATRARRRLERDTMIAVGLIAIALVAVIRIGNPFMEKTTPATPPVRVGDEVITFAEGTTLKAIHADGSHETTLASPCAAKSCLLSGYSWSPTGSEVVLATYLRNRNHDPLYVVRSDGTRLHILRGCPAGHPSWSPDSSRIATVVDVNGGYPATVYTCAAEGGDVRRMKYPIYNDPVSWSPDGKELGYVSQYEGLVAESADGTGARVVSHRPSEWGSGTAWSPDGSTIAFVNNANRAQLWVVNADGSDPHVVLEVDGGMGWPVWSPDGSQLAVEAGDPRTGHASLFVIAPDGSGKTELLTGGFNGPGPVWDPSGAALAVFLHSDLLVIPTDGSAVWTVAKSIHDPGYASLAWQPNAPSTNRP